MGSGQSNSTVEDVDIFIQELIKIAQKEDTKLLDLQTKIEQSSFGIEAKNRHSKTALRIAVDKRNLKAVKALLKQNANVNTTCEHNETPLMVAAKNGDLGILECLLEKQANVNEISSNGVSAIVLAASNRHESCLKRLLESKVKQGNSTQGSGNSNSYCELENALTCHLDDEGVLLLLQNISTTENEKRELLGKVAKRGLPNCVKYLLDGIDDLSAVIETALTCALQSKKEECIRSVLMKYNQETGRRAIVRLMTDGLKTDCETLLKLKNERQTSSFKKMFNLCNNESATSTVQTPDVCQDDKIVALRKAAKNGDSELLGLLIKYLAEPAEQSKPNKSTSVSDNSSRTAFKNGVFIYKRALVAATTGGREECVKVLIGEINKFSHRNLQTYRSALREALKELKPELCEYCKAQGVDKADSCETPADIQQVSDNSTDQSSEDKIKGMDLQERIQNCIQKINDAVVEKLDVFLIGFQDLKDKARDFRVTETEKLIKDALKLSIVLDIQKSYRKMQSRCLRREHRQTRAIAKIEERETEILKPLEEVKKIFDEALKEASSLGNKDKRIIDVFNIYKSEKMFAKKDGSHIALENSVFRYEKALETAAADGHEVCVQVLIDEISKLPGESNRLHHRNLKIYRFALSGALKALRHLRPHCNGATEAGNQEMRADDQEALNRSSDQGSEGDAKRIQTCIQKINDAVLKTLDAFLKSFQMIKFRAKDRLVKETKDLMEEALKLSIVVLEIKEDYRKTLKKMIKRDAKQRKSMKELMNEQTRILKPLKEFRGIFHETLQEAESTWNGNIVDVLRHYESEKVFANDNDIHNACEDDVSNYMYKWVLVAAAEGDEDFVRVFISSDETNKFSNGNIEIYMSALRGATKEYVSSCCTGIGAIEDRSRNSAGQSSENNRHTMDLQRRIHICIQMINNVVLEKLETFRERFKSIQSTVNVCGVKETEDLIKESLKLCIALDINEDYQKLQRRFPRSEARQTEAAEVLRNGQTQILKRVEEIKSIFHEALQEAERTGSKQIIGVFKKYESERLFAERQQQQYQTTPTATAAGATTSRAAESDCMPIM